MQPTTHIPEQAFAQESGELFLEALQGLARPLHDRRLAEATGPAEASGPSCALPRPPRPFFRPRDRVA